MGKISHLALISLFLLCGCQSVQTADNPTANSSDTNESAADETTAPTDPEEPADQTDSRETEQPEGNTEEDNTDQESANEPETPATLRLMAANLTSTSSASYAGQGARIFMAIQPDIVMIQEFNYIPNFASDTYDDSNDQGYQYASREDFVQKVFGAEYQFVIDDDYAKNDAIPNGIISRYPILESGVLTCTGITNRQNQWARIDIPGEKDLWAISVHLATDDSKRTQETADLVEQLQQLIPADSYIVLGGDFNHGNHGSSTIKALKELFVITKENYPADQNGLTTTNKSRAKVNDAIFASQNFDQLEIPVSISGHDFTYPDGLVFDSQVFTPLSAVTPVLATDSSANFMQHMPVIRDFTIQ